MTVEGAGKRRALGRGLDALLPTASSAHSGYGDKSVFQCAIEKLVPQKGQPRQHFDDASLEELAQSIVEHGLIEPLVVRRAGSGAASGTDSFEIIAGERRWRAAQKAGLQSVLVVVKDVSPKAAFELAIIENVQREDLNPVELAEALDRLVKEHGYTQDALAERLGKDRSTISNSFASPQAAGTRAREGHHRRALRGACARALGRARRGVHRRAGRQGASRKLSVRSTEALVRATGGQGEARVGERRAGRRQRSQPRKTRQVRGHSRSRSPPRARARRAGRSARPR